MGSNEKKSTLRIVVSVCYTSYVEGGVRLTPFLWYGLTPDAGLFIFLFFPRGVSLDTFRRPWTQTLTRKKKNWSGEVSDNLE